MEEVDTNLLPAEICGVVDLARQALGMNLIAAYAYGSAVAGGLRTHSDVDILAVISGPTTQPMRRQLVDGLLEISAPAATSRATHPIELTVVVLSDVRPWRYPPRCDLQYGEWLRDVFSRGEIPSPRHDPDLTILLHTVLKRSVALTGPPAAQLFDPSLSDDLRRAIVDVLPEVVRGWKGDERNALLTLSRMWVTLTTGDILPKDEAASHVIGLLPSRHRRVLQLAAAEYLGQQRVGWSSHSADVAALVSHLEGIIAAAGAGTNDQPS